MHTAKKSTSACNFLVEKSKEQMHFENFSAYHCKLNEVIIDRIKNLVENEETGGIGKLVKQHNKWYFNYSFLVGVPIGVA